MEYFKQKIGDYAADKHYFAKMRKERPNSQYFLDAYDKAVVLLVLYRDRYKEKCEQLHDLIPYR